MNAERVPAITPRELQRRLAGGERIVIVDVREPWEWALGTIAAPDLRRIALGDLPSRWRELDPADEIVLVCHAGVRSAMALAFLRRAGFPRLRNLTGGTDAWSDEVDPSLPKY
jgi:adenylyltransferase/sulfurtransferase